MHLNARGARALRINHFCREKSLMARRMKWLTPSIVFAFLGNLIIAAIPSIMPYFQESKLRYSTNELMGYPVPYHDDKPAPGDIQGQVLAGGLVRYMTVVVWSDEKRSVSGAMARIPFSKADELLNGWISDSATPSKVYMLGTENQLPKLLPGDIITFYMSLGNLNSDLANRIEVFDGDGRPATHYQYVSARDAGSNVLVDVPMTKSSVYIFVFGTIVLLGVFWKRGRKPISISPDKQTQEDAVEEPPRSASASKAQDHESRGSSERRGSGGRMR